MTGGQSTGSLQQAAQEPAGCTFPLEAEYARNIAALETAGILTGLELPGSRGIVGSDGQEYPLPTLAEVRDIFDRNRGLAERKIAQGFRRLEMVPLALPAGRFIGCLEAAIRRRAAAGTILRTRAGAGDPPVPVRVNAEKLVWIWENLHRALSDESIVYFPQEYSQNHAGTTKSGAIRDPAICALPGWSVMLAEEGAFMPEKEQGITIGGRKQLEIGLSPNEYLRILSRPEYAGETGMTLEDFMTRFLVRLETCGEVSNDVEDNNALWCLAQYLRVPYAQLVPTGRWYRKVGRVRLDMHRSNNRQCTKSWGAATVVRFSGSP